MPLIIRKEVTISGLKSFGFHKRFLGIKERAVYLRGSDNSCATIDFSDSLKDKPQQLIVPPKPKKSVSFNSLDIREYTQILGDHPFCSDGAPVSLGWNFEVKPSVLLDEYEKSRCSRRSGESLRLSVNDRREILQDYSDNDVRRVQRRLHRARSSNRRQEERMMRTFFRPEPIPAVVKKCPE
mmetsp:Transcript_24318/g.34792  ORF Transcript_24318/g.34792 Transcript_24318/m.34792 type:complete len:182 (+) Transcript_24318:301-846(+)|eukprot:CAMPEP_0202456840 /NCGR_PEP_ID=MMETSP1360-20130828/14007_1 /ASSEMBLY_ACC=CAM_ASM_000848 /TAXON_ID=515479 /ORGANISM="Licmophora paradoxa, Strain CCMP2313" /LENGTH=181 /DNA_ID=CAMNT_0049076773 /DNA_START=289 /DNA_END=834 /DNA_ORIENTATION=+